MTTLHDRPIELDGHHPQARYWTKAGPVDSEMLVADEISVIEERQEASTGEPAIMALFGFAVGTFVVAYPIAGFLPSSALTAAVPPVLLFAGLAQFIGGLIAFRRNNAFAGTAFCAYGANNAVIATFFLMQTTGAISAAPGSSGMQMLALEMYCFAVISLVLAVAAARLNLIFVLLLLALVPGFTLPAITNWFGAAADPFLGHLGGYFLIASAALAAYAGAAMVVNSTWQTAVLPLVPLHRNADVARLPRNRAAAASPAGQPGTARPVSAAGPATSEEPTTAAGPAAPATPYGTAGSTGSEALPPQRPTQPRHDEGNIHG